MLLQLLLHHLLVVPLLRSRRYRGIGCYTLSGRSSPLHSHHWAPSLLLLLMRSLPHLLLRTLLLQLLLMLWHHDCRSRCCI